MLNLNETNTWVGLIGAPMFLGGALDLFVKAESKARLFARLESLSQMLSRPWVIYCVGFLASVAAGLACIHVAGLNQKIDGLGGWWTAIQSAAPIALFLVFKAVIADPLLFWGSGRFYATLKGNDAYGRAISRSVRWFMMGLLLLGACVFTQAILSGAEAAQESSLRKIIPDDARVRVPEPTASPSANSRISNPESALTSVSDIPERKPFDVRDVLTSFNLVVADFYAHAFLILNGVACFVALIGFIRAAKWCASHIDVPMVPKFLFTAMALASSICIALLLVGYRLVESI